MPEIPPDEVTLLLERAREGESLALKLLFERIYEQLRAISRNLMRDERPNHSLGATSLVHEAVLRLIADDGIDLRLVHDRRSLFGLARRTMWRILVDHARHRQAQKRKGNREPLDDEKASFENDAFEALAIEDAFQELGRRSPRQEAVMRLRLVEGLTITETAERLDLSNSLVEKESRIARAWLHDRLKDGED